MAASPELIVPVTQSGKSTLSVDLKELRQNSPSLRKLNQLNSQVIGQPEALECLAQAVAIAKSGYTGQGVPLRTIFFAGPTGTGKTSIIEKFVFALKGNQFPPLMINCAEYGDSHEVSKLIGAPPGYIGHDRTVPILTQERIDLQHTPEYPFSIIVFDEIEKAHPHLFDFLLGVMGAATATNGLNNNVNFSKTIIFFTSNIGAREVNNLIEGPKIGLIRNRKRTDQEEHELQSRIKERVITAVRAKFKPEFYGRLDDKIVFDKLTEEQLGQILDLQVEVVATRVRTEFPRFQIHLSPLAKSALRTQGTDERYGARPMVSAVRNLLIVPLSLLKEANVLAPDASLGVDWSGDDFTFTISHQKAPAPRADTSTP